MSETAAISVVGTAGVVLIAAAAVGGGLALAGAHVPVISSVPRQVIVGVVGAALLALDLAYVSPDTTTTPTSSSTPFTASSTTSSQAAAAQPTSCRESRAQPVRAGAVVDLDPRYGVDLDCGVILAAENSPGADVSGRVDGRILDAKGGGQVAWVDSPAPDVLGRCRDLPLKAWVQALKELDVPQPNRGICVRTGEGNMAIVTLDRPSTPDNPRLSFHYRIEYR